MKLKAGTTAFLTRGEYSDFSVITHVTALKDIDTKVLARRFKAVVDRKPRKAGEFPYYDPYEYLPWLIKSGYVAEMEEVPEWYVGVYQVGDSE